MKQMQKSDLFGRQQFVLTIPPELAACQLQRRPAMTVVTSGKTVQCHRCHTISQQRDVALCDGQFYCPACLQLGRIDSRGELISLPEPNQFQVRPPLLTWSGQLTPQQQQVSQAILTGFQHQQQRLVWAVTGAGKTEMLFEGLAWALTQGWRVAIAAPRIDVCLELMPRLQAAFQKTPILLLYGGQTEAYRYTQFVLCTTHQLLRFYHAFDVLVIDEVDAFPYARNAVLQVATQQALKPTGRRLYLTATPSAALKHQVQVGQLQLSYLPRRYHGHPLAQPRVWVTPGWQRQLVRQRLTWRLKQLLQQKIQRQQAFLLFVPRIALLAPLAACLKQLAPHLRFETVHAADPQREAKILAMRQQRYQALITTTILERGVTFANIDVIVLGADDPVFTTAALVQMAGRTGRKAAYPEGQVDFMVQGYNRSIKAACRQIRQMNRACQ
ncbi:DNA helicase [Loigolactobacillus bifermentans DSM 20003]|uniref:DNA helicase n=2 Tax=Loigolactobacillus bifermentans TaxID=1607 RepID=A0A0R1H687_9LACO|nr:DNA helicase [Loigolactobacillus bifermentans DSM 20003]QGG61824.1 DEAD/DEAH box helicase [Loigolactobacillus bifermentans]